MTRFQGNAIQHLDASIWHTLELVRLRQTPWHKKQVLFDKLQALGLIEAVPQKTLAPSQFPPPLIAVLTDGGRQALEVRLSQQAAVSKFLND